MLIDTFSRKFSYLRLSLTEKCNFKCSYCLPNGYGGCKSNDHLDLNEIRNLATAFKELGIKKIRLTGGEPTLRNDVVEIISTLKNDVGISEVALTTNGFRLQQLALNLKSAGLDAINISLDSLKAEKFNQICGVNKGDSILNAVDRCLELGFKKVKINSVLLKGLNEDEFSDFVEYVKHRPVAVRFIELMRTGDNKDYFSQHHVTVDSKIKILKRNGWTLEEASETNGPAKEFCSPNYLGKIGFISPYSKNFCTTCNRLRVSSTGGLRLCLFGDGELPLRKYLQHETDREPLKKLITTGLFHKPESHRLHQNVYGNMNSLSAIGG